MKPGLEPQHPVPGWGQGAGDTGPCDVPLAHPVPPRSLSGQDLSPAHWAQPPLSPFFPVETRASTTGPLIPNENPQLYFNGPPPHFQMH